MFDLMGGEVTLSEKEVATGDGAPEEELVPRKSEPTSTFAFCRDAVLEPALEALVLEEPKAFCGFPFVVTAEVEEVVSIEPNDCTGRVSAFVLEGGVSLGGEEIGADLSFTVPKLSEFPVGKIE